MIGRFLCWLGLHRWIVGDETFGVPAPDERVYMLGYISKFCPRCNWSQVVNLLQPEWAKALEPKEDDLQTAGDFVGTHIDYFTKTDASASRGGFPVPQKLYEAMFPEEPPKKKRGRPRKNR